MMHGLEDAPSKFQMIKLKLEKELEKEETPFYVYHFLQQKDLELISRVVKGTKEVLKETKTPWEIAALKLAHQGKETA